MGTIHVDNSSLMTVFALNSPEQIRSFFTEHKGNFRESAVVKIRRIAHFLRTQTWINSRNLHRHVSLHREEKVSVFFDGHRMCRKLRRLEEGLGSPSESSTWKNMTCFVKEFLRNRQNVGACLPSSAALTREIVRDIASGQSDQGRLILEIGPGTGAFTDKIIAHMNSNDELHLVELNETFCMKLSEKYRNLSNVKVVQQSIFDYKPEKKYDFVISGLPLNGFPVPEVKTFFEKIPDFMKENGRFSYFDYYPLLRAGLFFKRRDAPLRRIFQIKERFFKEWGQRETTVYQNVPMARVRHHHFATVTPPT